ncbi:pyridoxamine 5'-phosphate oxidase family protein [Streptomyces sp. NPDC056580]|uniref:pyridoxamine 5'-phosphate oxidase family protein n=1 Tax=Streptomyces sp. NPDC056580 TaxID=3345872 RepID=UPI0036CAD7E2
MAGAAGPPGGPMVLVARGHPATSRGRASPPGGGTPDAASGVLDGGDIVIRGHDGAALTAHAWDGDGAGVVAAYEADVVAPDSHLGGSVVATGYARLVTDPAELARYRALPAPWTGHAMDRAVRISPDLITGVRLTSGA